MTMLFKAIVILSILALPFAVGDTFAAPKKHLKWGEQRELSKALKTFKRHPKDFMVALSIAQIYEKQHNWHQAQEWAGTALKLQPGNAKVLRYFSKMDQLYMAVSNLPHARDAAEAGNTDLAIEMWQEHQRKCRDERKQDQKHGPSPGDFEPKKNKET